MMVCSARQWIARGDGGGVCICGKTVRTDVSEKGGGETDAREMSFCNPDWVRNATPTCGRHVTDHTDIEMSR